MPKNQDDELSILGDSEIDAMMSKELSFMEQSGGSTVRRVKVGKMESWRVRFLPVKLGTNRLPFARVARHWINKKPFNCRRLTAVSFGGQEDYDCPLCAVVDKYNRSENEEISKAAYSCRAETQWTFYCLVREIDRNGNVTTPPFSELVKPYECSLYKNLALELIAKWRQGAKRIPGSIADFEKGNDFYLQKGIKNMSMDKQEPSPIFEGRNPEKVAAAIQTLMAEATRMFRMPSFLTTEKLEGEADKLAESLSGSQSRSQRKPATMDDDDAGFSRATSGGSKYNGIDEDEDDPAPVRETPKPAARRPAMLDEDDAGVDQEGQVGIVSRKPTPLRKPAVEDEEDDNSPPPARKTTASAKVPPGADDNGDDDEDGVAEELEDPVPASNLDDGDTFAQEDEDVPPPVKAPRSNLSASGVPEGKRVLNSRIKEGIGALRNRE